MAEVPSASSAPPPSLAEATGWVGREVDEIGGAGVGRVHSFFVDAAGGEPVWLIAKLGGRRSLSLRRRQARLVAIPLRDCAAGASRVWVAHGRETIRSAPVVDSTRPLLREHELTICAHFGIGETLGRAAEVAGRDEGTVTAKPAN